jgi:hypothetical protein
MNREVTQPDWGWSRDRRQELAFHPTTTRPRSSSLLCVWQLNIHA